MHKVIESQFEVFFFFDERHVGDVVKEKNFGALRKHCL